MNKRFNVFSYLIASIALCLFFASQVSAQTVAAPPPSAQEIKTKIDEYMNAAARVNHFTGSILVARDGKPVVSKGYGMGNIELNVPNTPQTVFRLGSVTKQFTGLAIVMLQERGKLNVNDSICKYFTDCPATWQPMTIKNLLTHTAGLANYTNFPDFSKIAGQPTTVAEVIARFRDKPLEFAVGEKYAYSNSGYYLLGAIIEKVTGKSYADFLQENIFAPLGMKQTAYDDPLVIVKNRADGYGRKGDDFINAASFEITNAYAAGALHSSTEDLLLWDQALYTEKLASRKSLDEAFTPLKSGYGYGWNIGKKFDRPVIAHGGSIYGFATHIARYPADRVTVIVLSNNEAAPAGEIANNLAAIVFGAAFEFPKERKEIQVAAQTLEKYVGDYELAPNLVLTVTLENGKLMGQAPTRPKFEIYAETETDFFVKAINAQITFVKEADGTVTKLIWRQGGGGGIQAPKIK